MSWDAWAAGFIDGDGAIQICRNKNHTGNGYSYYVKMTAAQKSRTPLDRLVLAYGGKIYKTKNRMGDWYVWSLNSSACLPALHAMLPWFVVKKARAELAIQFLTEQNDKIRMWEQMRNLQGVELWRI